jgi:hypothetical protein
VAGDYHTFIHLLGPDGQIVAQADAPPMQGQYPTLFWQMDEELLDSYVLQVPADVPPGEYLLRIGLYELATGQRLLLENGDDGIQLTNLNVQQ